MNSIDNKEKNIDKINIAFIMPDMELGGVEKSLLSLLNAIGDTRFRITLLLFKAKGELLDFVPEWVEVKVLKCKLNTIRRFFSDSLRKLNAKGLFSFFKALYHKYGNKLIQHSKMRMQGFKYDVVIAYKDGLSTWFTAQNDLAPVKIAFIHTDLKSAGYNQISQKEVYNSFNRIYCNSVASKERFLNMLPEYASKTYVLYNILDPQLIKNMAEMGEGYSDNFSGIRILTIGRLSHEKGIDKAIEVAAMLKSSNYSFRWYIVGDGTDRNLLKRKADKLHVEREVVFLGKKLNPYRFLKDCDIYVQPSNYEGYCISLTEARLFAKPIVTCDFCGAREQIIDGKTGIIAGMSVDELYIGVRKLIENENLQLYLHNNLLQYNNYSFQGINEFCNYLEKCNNVTDYSKAGLF